ncbi:MAG: hypothetical protein RBT49_15675 [Bacteroidales bacterium]|jgi:hypothetical protein|nr:hypothetical protein [Bacteroidales bacterium]
MDIKIPVKVLNVQLVKFKDKKDNSDRIFYILTGRNSELGLFEISFNDVSLYNELQANLDKEIELPLQIGVSYSKRLIVNINL